MAVFGETTAPIEGLRYVAELSHPEMFVLDLLNSNIKRKTLWLILDEVKADQFDYLVFVGRGHLDPLKAFPSSGWDPLKSRDDLSGQLRMGDEPQIRTDEKTQRMMDGQSQAALKEWNMRFRQFTKRLLQRKWKRVDLSVGPIYQAVDEG